MASIRKLESGSYQVRFRDGTGRERLETFAKKAHADRFRRDVEYELDRGDWVDPKAGQVTLSDWVDEAWELAAPVGHALPVTGKLGWSTMCCRCSATCR